MQFLNDFEVTSRLVKKLQSIRVSGINQENKLEAHVYFKCIFKYFDINFPKDDIKINYNKNYFDMDNTFTIRLFFSVLDELIIYGYYLNIIDYTFSFIDKLQLLPNIYNNYYQFDQMLNNKTFYIPKLEVVKSVKIPIVCDINFVPMNTSILKKDYGYLIFCRTVNYRLYSEGKYEILDPQKIQKSSSIICKLDKDFKITFQHNVIDKSNCTKYSASNILGMEDGVILDFNAKLVLSCSELNTNPMGRSQISICDIDDNFDIVLKIPMNSPENRPEKNWLPYINKDNKISFIYSFNPYKLLEYDDNLKVNQINNYMPLEISGFKGSAGPIIFSDGYLIVIHQTTHKIRDIYTPLYSHRFILLDKNYNPIKMSKQFYFERYGIEFCKGMCYSHNSDEIILTYSVNDSNCNISIVKVDIINKMLKNIDKYIILDGLIVNKNE